MYTRLTKIILTALFILVAVLSCNDDKNKFTVEGVVSNADTLMLYLEQRGLSEISTLDSTKLDSNGSFSFSKETLGYPEFYRLRLGDQAINFSIDSTETVVIKAEKSTFASNYEVEGSYSSSKIKEVLLLQLKLRQSAQKLRASYDNGSLKDQVFLDSITSEVEKYKETAGNMILDNYKSTVAYFILFQKIDDQTVFDPTIKKDLNLFRAVATIWDTYYPNSPRTKQLKDYTLKAVANQKAIQSQKNIIDMLSEGKEVNNKEFYNVTLPDVNGKQISTSSLTGKTVILDFTAYSTESSLAHNIRLNKVYEKYKSKLTIYQVSLDEDKHKWLNAAINLPWICVWEGRSLNSPLIGKFNIEGIPTSYILDKDGNIVKKVGIHEDLEAEITKAL